MVAGMAVGGAWSLATTRKLGRECQCIVVCFPFPSFNIWHPSLWNGATYIQGSSSLPSQTFLDIYPHKHKPKVYYNLEPGCFLTQPSQHSKLTTSNTGNSHLETRVQIAIPQANFAKFKITPVLKLLRQFIMTSSVSVGHMGKGVTVYTGSLRFYWNCMRNDFRVLQFLIFVITSNVSSHSQSHSLARQSCENSS